jgi:hypothetical protein
MAGCASHPIALSPVGPESAGVDRSDFHGTGYLKVYSDTKSRVVGDGPPYYTHTGYNIYDPSGRRIKYVPNHIGDMDEAPTVVTVPAGNYYIVAQSAAYGRVTVPVVIKGGCNTTIHLDRQWRPSPNAPSNELVYLPDGEPVGWSGATTASAK